MLWSQISGHNSIGSYVYIDDSHVKCTKKKIRVSCLKLSSLDLKIRFLKFTVCHDEWSVWFDLQEMDETSKFSKISVTA